MTARIVFAVLLALQFVLALLRPVRPFGGDEPYYAGKARQILEHGIPLPASPEQRAIARGERWGTADWRPAGYPYFLAAVSLGELGQPWLRKSATVVQFALLALALTLLFNALGQTMLAAILLAATPWPFAFVTLIGPDSLNESMMLIATLLLCRRRFFTGSLLASLTFLLRPEMIALIPIVIAAAWWLSTRDKRDAIRAAIAFLLVVALQIGYRTYFIGEPGLFGKLRLADRGAFSWVHTWIGTEQQAYEFVYGLTNGNLITDLPARAFASEDERRRVMGLIARTQMGGYREEIDDAFAKLAAERRANDLLGAMVVPRIWHTIHLWVNTETNEQLLDALVFIPRKIRVPLLAALLALKIAVVLAFLIAIAKNRDPLLLLLALLAVVVIARTLLIGLVLDWMAHRYAVVAWPPLLGCVAALRTRYHLRDARLDHHPGPQPRGDAA